MEDGMPCREMGSGWSVPSQPPPAVQLCQPRVFQETDTEAGRDERRVIRQMLGSESGGGSGGPQTSW